jgi:uncharacterized membrane protein YedE/YeeE
MENFTPVASTIGGVLIGLAAAMLFLFNGKILGISNITAELLNPRWHGKAWRLTFVAGLLAGGLLLQLIYPQALSVSSSRSLALLTIAGLLVGYGSTLGRGCTSGHGICGISRLSVRSIAATGIFMLTGILTVYLTNHVFGGGA